MTFNEVIMWIMAIGIIYSLVWFKSGKVHPTVSYELEG